MRLLKLTYFAALSFIFLAISSCNPEKDAEPSVFEAQLKLLSANTDTGKPWTVSQVRFGAGNTDRTSEYSGMTLTVKGKFVDLSAKYPYEVAGRPQLSPWPASGTWSFDPNEPQNLIIRTEDNIPMTYSVVDGKLQLQFTYSGSGYAGRTSAVEGTWIFLFTSN